MLQDTMSFTKKLNIPSVIDFILKYFDKHMAMYKIAELCNFKDNITVSYNNTQLIYHVKNITDTKIICELLSTINIYQNKYRVKTTIIDDNSIDIQLI